MHIHILGICGTFMGGIAQIAAAAGHKVTGCDKNVYPPMSEQLEAAGIGLIQGFGADQMALHPDLWIVGNAMSRGNPLLEAILNAGERYTSGPQWIEENVLQGRHVLAVAGTHGKTTTSSMLAWILEYAGLNPGFLIGGVPRNFSVSARWRDTRPFVIEADEYDTAFCDKRSKFVHYHPRTAILNNLEYDHADIFPDLAAIETQFHHLVRTMPSSALVVANAESEALGRVLGRGCWSRLEQFGHGGQWQVTDGDRPVLSLGGEAIGELDMPNAAGHHNAMNAAAAIAAARDVGVDPRRAIEALHEFAGVKRRLEVRGTVRGVTLVEDFAHHPTAIRETIAALRSRMAGGRILAVLEPRSNTMKLGAMKSLLAGSLEGAELTFCFAGPAVSWDPQEALAPLGARARCYRDLDAVVRDVARQARSGDQILVMSNGSFGGIYGKLLAALASQEA